MTKVSDNEKPPQTMEEEVFKYYEIVMIANCPEQQKTEDVQGCDCPHPEGSWQIIYKKEITLAKKSLVWLALC